ncbi:isoprenylcysteine carboxyl methyltransferase [Acidobacteria bacterium AB60]|nr:isoprenylcysteine carboxyl methyltransferase [Acidobacteria bacterium AB60]
MASFRRNLIASILFTLLGGPGLLLVILPWSFTHFRIVPGPNEVIGWLLIGLGVIPLLESISRFVVVGRGSLVPTVPTENLVVSGLYRFVRNPMYVGVGMGLAGEALLFWSTSIVIELAVSVAIMDIFVRFYEEPKLTRTYGESYRRYRRNVRRWVPRLTPWRG